MLLLPFLYKERGDIPRDTQVFFQAISDLEQFTKFRRAIAKDDFRVKYRVILFYRALAVLQMLYIISCCDYVSYFRSNGKKVSLMFGIISQRGSSLVPVTHSLAFCLFRLIYFTKHKSAFLPFISYHALFTSLQSENSLESDIVWLKHIRDKMWQCIQREDETMQNSNALSLRKKRRGHTLKLPIILPVFNY